MGKAVATGLGNGADLPANKTYIVTEPVAAAGANENQDQHWDQSLQTFLMSNS